MYIPPHFEETDTSELHRLIEANSFGALVLDTPDGLDANHLPFLLQPGNGAATKGSLLAHVARANPVWQTVADGAEALVIFQAAHGYISPRWYPSNDAESRLVPTWNYQVVHVHGRFRVRDDAAFVRGVIARLTRVHEAASRVDKPWKMSDSSKDNIDALAAAIVGIEVEIDRIVGKLKLSQNREPADALNAAEESRRRGGDALADAMVAAVKR